jgi:hypothetical protein
LEFSAHHASAGSAFFCAFHSRCRSAAEYHFPSAAYRSRHSGSEEDRNRNDRQPACRKAQRQRLPSPLQPCDALQAVRFVRDVAPGCWGRPGHTWGESLQPRRDSGISAGQNRWPHPSGHRLKPSAQASREYVAIGSRGDEVQRVPRRVTTAGEDYLYVLQGRAPRAGPRLACDLGWRRASVALTMDDAAPVRTRWPSLGKRCAAGGGRPSFDPSGHVGAAARCIPVGHRPGISPWVSARRASCKSGHPSGAAS